MLPFDDRYTADDADEPSNYRATTLIAIRCRHRVISLNVSLAALWQIEYIKRFDRVECRPLGPTLSRGVDTTGPLAAQCSMCTSIT